MKNKLIALLCIVALLTQAVPVYTTENTLNSLQEDGFFFEVIMDEQSEGTEGTNEDSNLDDSNEPGETEESEPEEESSGATEESEFDETEDPEASKVLPLEEETAQMRSSSISSTWPFGINADGTYLIADGSQLEYLSSQVNAGTNYSGAYFELTSDIDLSGISWVPIGTESSPFYGSLYGNGHTIKNLNINLPNQTFVGLIGKNGGDIKDLNIEGGSVTGSTYTGVLAAQNSGIIRNCTVTGLSSLKGGSRTGGLVGYNTGAITECLVSGISSLTGGSYTGGLVGDNTASGIISGSSVTDVSLLTGSDYVGGLSGYNYGSVSRSYATVNVRGSNCVGGLIGYQSGNGVEHCYATGNVAATVTTASSGGFVGYFSGGSSDSIRNSFAMGNVSGFTAGGFVGKSSSGVKIENCYSLSSHANGLNGNTVTITNCYFNKDLSLSTKPEGRTTAQMQQQSTYVGWDFTTVWEMPIVGYPILRELEKPNHDWSYSIINVGADKDPEHPGEVERYMDLLGWEEYKRIDYIHGIAGNDVKDILMNSRIAFIMGHGVESQVNILNDTGGIIVDVNDDATPDNKIVVGGRFTDSTNTVTNTVMNGNLKWLGFFSTCSQLNYGDEMAQTSSGIAYTLGGVNLSSSEAWARTLLGSNNRAHGIIGYYGESPGNSGNMQPIRELFFDCLVEWPEKTIIESWNIANSGSWEYEDGGWHLGRSSWAAIVHRDNRMDAFYNMTADTLPGTPYIIDRFSMGTPSRHTINSSTQQSMSNNIPAKMMVDSQIERNRSNVAEALGLDHSISLQRSTEQSGEISLNDKHLTFVSDHEFVFTDSNKDLGKIEPVNFDVNYAVMNATDLLESMNLLPQDYVIEVAPINRTPILSNVPGIEVGNPEVLRYSISVLPAIKGIAVYTEANEGIRMGIAEGGAANISYKWSEELTTKLLNYKLNSENQISRNAIAGVVGLENLLYIEVNGKFKLAYVTDINDERQIVDAQTGVQIANAR